MGPGKECIACKAIRLSEERREKEAAKKNKTRETEAKAPSKSNGWDWPEPQPKLKDRRNKVAPAKEREGRETVSQSNDLSASQIIVPSEVIFFCHIQYPSGRRESEYETIKRILRYMSPLLNMLWALSTARVTKTSLILSLLYHWQLLVINKLATNLSLITASNDNLIVELPQCVFKESNQVSTISFQPSLILGARAERNGLVCYTKRCLYRFEHVSMR